MSKNYEVPHYTIFSLKKKKYSLRVFSIGIKMSTSSSGKNLNGHTHIDTMVVSKAFFFFYLGGT